MTESPAGKPGGVLGAGANGQKRIEEMTLTACSQVGPRLHVLTAQGSGAPQFAPGQFVQVLPSGAGAPILPRPLSILRWEDGQIDLLVKVVGRGTHWLSSLPPGSQFRVMGPLGRGFQPQRPPAALLVAGGVGVAPLLPLARRLAGEGISTVFVYGAATGGELALRWELQATGARLMLATDDGSVGHHGDVLGPVRQLEADVRMSGQAGWVAACGPWAMMRRLWRDVGNWGWRMEVSLEARMACGVGACLGCAVRMHRATGLAYVCSDGPVFDAAAVDWDRSPP